MLETLTGPGVIPRDLFVRGAARAWIEGHPILVSWTGRVPALDPIDVFAQGRSLAAECCYWERSSDGAALAGIGAAHVVAIAGGGRFEQARQRWRELLANAIVDDAGVGPMLVGGFAFEPAGPKSELWRGFGAGCLVLPRLALTQADGVCRLTVNCVLAPGMAPEDEAGRADEEIRRLLTIVRPASTSRPSRAPVLHKGPSAKLAWERLVANSVREIGNGAFEKVVLGRAVNLRADHPITLEPMLRRLRAQEPGCTVFAIALPGRCFVGATPEQLVRLRDGVVRVDCLAGTISRRSSEETDRLAGQQLLASAKDRAEHAVVVRTIRDALGVACLDLTVPEQPGLLRTRSIQHLHTAISGRTVPGEDVLSLVERLHPTPAVGGCPREAALAFIRENERLDRGWYAGPIGWVDQHGDGDFVVGIRSALLHGEASPEGGYAAAMLFAGCGIVAGSDPEKEYAESRLKLRPMLDALGWSYAD